LRGFFGIGIYAPKNGVNIGTLWRSAYIYDAAFIFTIGRRYQKQASDTVYSTRHVPLFNYLTYEDFYKNIPYDCRLICIENSTNAKLLQDFNHPERAVYLLGAEDSGLPRNIIDKNIVVRIPSAKQFSLNVATAGSIVMYDRFIKGAKL
jgi:tRNA(Leu) C34 or U34 (ribose-2'-O)-methylase TrmL